MVKGDLGRVGITTLDLNEFTEKVDLEGRHVKVIGDGGCRIAGYAVANEKVMEYNERSREVPLSFFPFIKRDFKMKEGEFLTLSNHTMFSVILIYSEEGIGDKSTSDVSLRFIYDTLGTKDPSIIDCHSIYEEPGEEGGYYTYCFFTKQLRNTPNLVLPAYVVREMVNVIIQDIKEKDQRYSLTELVDKNRRTLFGIIEDFISNKEIIHFNEDESLSLKERKYNRRIYRRINQQFIVKEIDDFLYRERLPYQVFHEKLLFIIKTDKDLPDGSRYFGVMSNPGNTEPLRKLTREEKNALRGEIKENGFSVSYMQNKDHSRTGVFLANPPRARYISSESPKCDSYSTYHYLFVGKPNIGTVLDTMRRYKNIFRDKGGISRFVVDKEIPLVTFSKLDLETVDGFFLKHDFYISEAGDYFIKHTEYTDAKVINVVL
nr:MAG TPA: hypothetical protein [Caudoviricetes sp.]